MIEREGERGREGERDREKERQRKWKLEYEIEKQESGIE